MTHKVIRILSFPTIIPTSQSTLYPWPDGIDLAQFCDLGKWGAPVRALPNRAEEATRLLEPTDRVIPGQGVAQRVGSAPALALHEGSASCVGVGHSKGASRFSLNGGSLPAGLSGWTFGLRVHALGVDDGRASLRHGVSDLLGVTQDVFLGVEGVLGVDSKQHDPQFGCEGGDGGLEQRIATVEHHSLKSLFGSVCHKGIIGLVSKRPSDVAVVRLRIVRDACRQRGVYESSHGLDAPASRCPSRTVSSKEPISPARRAPHLFAAGTLRSPSPAVSRRRRRSARR